MLYAVTDDRLDSIFFVCDRPENSQWTVTEGVEVIVPFNYRGFYARTEPEDEEDASGPMIAESTSRPNSYAVYSNPRDLDPERFRPTGYSFGGVFSRSSWERFEEGYRAHMERNPSDYPPRVGVPGAARVGQES